jgi:hypothetical protein
LCATTTKNGAQQTSGYVSPEIHIIPNSDVVPNSKNNNGTMNKALSNVTAPITSSSKKTPTIDMMKNVGSQTITVESTLMNGNACQAHNCEIDVEHRLLTELPPHRTKEAFTLRANYHLI